MNCDAMPRFCCMALVGFLPTLSPFTDLKLADFRFATVAAGFVLGLALLLREYMFLASASGGKMVVVSVTLSVNFGKTGGCNFILFS